MNRLTLALIAAFVLLTAGDAAAQRSLALRASAGTLGPGAELVTPLSVQNALNIRLGGSFLPYNYSDVIDDDAADVEFTADGRVGAVSAVVDWHPFSNAIRFSGGLLVNLFQLDGDAVPVTGYCVEDRQPDGTCASKEFSPEELGTLTASLDYSSAVAPYVGFGLGNAIAGRSDWSFMFDLGLLYTSSPSVDLEGTGLIAPTANHEATLNEGIESFRWYPNLSIGVAYRFR